MQNRQERNQRPKIILVVRLIFLIDFCVTQKRMVLEGPQATCSKSQHTNIEIVRTSPRIPDALYTAVTAATSRPFLQKEQRVLRSRRLESRVLP